MTAQSSQAAYRAQFGTIEEFRREYVGMAPILQNCIENFRSWDQLSYAPSIRVRADKWIADGVALVGDAALAVNPITSQGAGLALEGGNRLATVVKHCFDRGDFSAQSLAPYEAWCRPQAESIQELGDLSAWAFSSKNRILASFNQRMLRRLESNPRMKRYILAYHSGLHWLTPGGLDWRDGLVVAGFWPNYKKNLGRKSMH
jgi:2-polyprenyl-6-methoxyphenol hydroxylase-like FAD-dependent oxidoreductase